MKGNDILFFAEDPGAANYIVHLPEACRDRQYASGVISAGKAAAVFDHYQIPTTPVEAYKDANAACRLLNPRLIVTGTSENPDSFGLHLIEEARKRNTPSIAVVDASMNAAYRLRGMTNNAMAYLPDLIFVPDRWTQNEFIRLGFAESKVRVCGHPQYDYIVEKRKVLERQDRNQMRQAYFSGNADDRPVVVFASEISDGLNPKQFRLSSDYTLKGRGGSSQRTHIVLEEFLDALTLLPEMPYKILRLHPKDQKHEYLFLSEEFDLISQQEPVYDLIYAADFIVGLTSMLLLEAALLGKRTFSIVPRSMEKKWPPGVRAGITWSAATRAEIRSQIIPFFQIYDPIPLNVLKKKFVFNTIRNCMSEIGRILKK